MSACTCAMLLAGLAPFAQPARPPVEAVERAGLGCLAAKIAAGEPVTVAYFGGSITAGGGSSSEEHCWRRAVHTWLEARWPEVHFTHVNAAIGGTGSELGACRLGREVLAHDPDLVFFEYSVNDGGRSREGCIATLEGVIRQIRRHDPTTDVIVLHTLHQGAVPIYQSGDTPQPVQGFEEAADHYGVPSLDLAAGVSRMLAGGEIAWDDFSKDSCHPTDQGYQLFTDWITARLEAWLSDPKPPHELTLPEPLDPANWEHATMTPIGQMPDVEGGRPDDYANFGWARDMLPGLLLLDTPGEELRFRFRGTLFGLNGIIGPDSGTIGLIIDGEDRGKHQLWDPWCTYYRVQAHFLASGLADGEHEAVIRVLDEKAEQSTGHALRVAFVLNNGEAEGQ